MKAVTHYEVNGHLFSDKELALAVEDILTQYSDLKFDVDNNAISVKVVNVILAPFKRRYINVFRLFYRKCSHKCSHFAMPSILQFL